MATLTLREYADLGVTYGKYIQAGREPGNGDQSISTSGTTAQSAAFNANTRLIMVSTPAAQAVSVEFGVNPTAVITGLRLQANSTFYFGVTPGHKMAAIDVA
jgi:hypothetical protein